MFVVWSNQQKNMLKTLNYTGYRNKCTKLLFKFNNEYDKNELNYVNVFINEIEQVKHCITKWLSKNNCVKRAKRRMRWQPVKNHHVKKIINNMSSRKSLGCDLVRMSDLIFSVDKVSPGISKWVNSSVTSHSFHSKLIEAIVRPIYKRDNSKNYSNYRTIAILSSVDKIIEKCIVEQLGNYLHKNNVLNICQHGFQKGK